METPDVIPNGGTGQQDASCAGKGKKMWMRMAALIVMTMCVASAISVAVAGCPYSPSLPRKGGGDEQMGAGARAIGAVAIAAASGTGYAAPHKAVAMPLTEDAVALSDIYAAPGTMVRLECYHPDATDYAWEIYDRRRHAWEGADSEMLTDELHRPVSALHITAEGTDTTAARCTIQMADGDAVTESASVYIIPEIEGISVAEEHVTDAGRYVSSREIPVHVSYTDGTGADITGLYGLSFVDSTTEKELSSDEDGNIIETITRTNVEHAYTYIGSEEKDLILRYRSGTAGDAIDTGMTVLGKDLCPPVISDISVGGYEISNVDIPVTAIVRIAATDDKTPYPDLEYAFLPNDAGVDPIPQDTDWTKAPEFELDIAQNGTWTAFCRDRGGNVASMEEEIVVVDQKAPVMTISLEDIGWCRSTWLCVGAEDYLPVEYRVISPDGTDSGWTGQERYEVSSNGTWEVQARDSAGNISTGSLSVGNIDRQEPVIVSITAEKAEEGGVQ